MLCSRCTSTKSEIENSPQSLMQDAAMAESRVRANQARKQRTNYVPTNNNNSDSGYFAYSNNRIAPLAPPLLSPSLGCWSRWSHAASTASLELGSHPQSWNRRISLRLASYQKFICLPTNSSKSIDSSSEAPSRASERFTYSPFTWSCF